jgi:secondary thiamine-phosphate synthase enzyme
METLAVRTQARSELVDITAQVRAIVQERNVENGVVFVFVPHTTAGITLNENADPDVRKDMLADLDRLAPWKQPYYAHYEGNSAAHMKASLIGASACVPVQDGRLAVGPWQGIYLCEFDGPRTRKVHVVITG